MATTLYPRRVGTGEMATTHLGANVPGTPAGNRGWITYRLSETSGALLANAVTGTLDGPVVGVDVTDSAIGGTGILWISPPVDVPPLSDISGTITANIWAQEATMTANVAINISISIIRASDLSGLNSSNNIVDVVLSTRTTELPSAGSNTVQNFTSGMTSGVYGAQTLNKGDRLLIRLVGSDGGGTMLGGSNFTVGYSGATPGVDGDTFLTFTETLSFLDDTTDPTGTTIYLTDTASDVSTASVDREAWTSRGSGVLNDVTNTTAGFGNPIQVTDTAGGTVVDWFTKQLDAFTLSGIARMNLRAKEGAITANASMRAEIARVDSDGTNPTIWSSWCLDPNGGTTASPGEIATTESPYNVWLSGDDLAISDGQRLRIRLYASADSLDTPAVGTVTSYYNGTSAAASGDMYVIFDQTLTEYTVPEPPGPVGQYITHIGGRGSC